MPDIRDVDGVIPSLTIVQHFIRKEGGARMKETTERALYWWATMIALAMFWGLVIVAVLGK